VETFTKKIDAKSKLFEAFEKKIILILKNYYFWKMSNFEFIKILDFEFFLNFEF